MIKYQKLAPNVPTPHRAHPTDAGVDLTANNLPGASGFKGKVAISPGHSQKFGTGIAVAVPDGYVGLLFVRSSVGCKLGLAPANAVGVIDADYRGGSPDRAAQPFQQHADSDYRATYLPTRHRPC